MWSRWRKSKVGAYLPLQPGGNIDISADPPLHRGRFGPRLDRMRPRRQGSEVGVRHVEEGRDRRRDKGSRAERAGGRWGGGEVGGGGGGK